jgi:hypothetical protein
MPRGLGFSGVAANSGSPFPGTRTGVREYTGLSPHRVSDASRAGLEKSARIMNKKFIITEIERILALFMKYKCVRGDLGL